MDEHKCCKKPVFGDNSWLGDQGIIPTVLCYLAFVGIGFLLGIYICPLLR